ncbi:MAG: hypothetical protein AAGA33_11505 [Pseudomonadota bacterium]
MMSCFSLADGISHDELSGRLERFVRACEAEHLISTASGLGVRRPHPVMDTDGRSFTHSFSLSFQDRAHCDAAVARFFAPDFPEKEAHEALFAAISEPEFFCWEE